VFSINSKVSISWFANPLLLICSSSPVPPEQLPVVHFFSTEWTSSSMHWPRYIASTTHPMGTMVEDDDWIKIDLAITNPTFSRSWNFHFTLHTNNAGPIVSEHSSMPRTQHWVFIANTTNRIGEWLGYTIKNGAHLVGIKMSSCQPAFMTIKGSSITTYTKRQPTLNTIPERWWVVSISKTSNWHCSAPQTVLFVWYWKHLCELDNKWIA
jgi:hypothetical protein